MPPLAFKARDVGGCDDDAIVAWLGRIGSLILVFCKKGHPLALQGFLWRGTRRPDLFRINRVFSGLPIITKYLTGSVA